jgi:hypothetical protein
MQWIITHRYYPKRCAILLTITDASNIQPSCSDRFSLSSIQIAPTFTYRSTITNYSQIQISPTTLPPKSLEMSK